MMGPGDSDGDNYLGLAALLVVLVVCWLVPWHKAQSSPSAQARQQQEAEREALVAANVKAEEQRREYQSKKDEILGAVKRMVALKKWDEAHAELKKWSAVGDDAQYHVLAKNVDLAIEHREEVARRRQANAAAQAVHANRFNSARCSALAEIAEQAYYAKISGHSMRELTQAIEAKAEGDTYSAMMAEGVIIAIYGDGSISSASQARAAAYGACS